MVVLDEDEFGQTRAVVDPTAGAHRGFLECPQPRKCLAGVPDSCGLARGADERSRERGDTREVAQEVERAALAGEHGSQRSFDAGNFRTRFELGTVVGEPSNPDCLIELREHLGRARGARQHAAPVHDDVGDGPGAGRHERGGDIAERAEILRQRTRGGIAHHLHRRVERAHCAGTATSAANGTRTSYMKSA